MYIIVHPKKDFRGVVGGVDFFFGKGSTNSKPDADRIAKTIGGEVVSKSIAEAVTPEASGGPKGNPTPAPKGKGKRKPMPAPKG